MIDFGRLTQGGNASVHFLLRPISKVDVGRTPRDFCLRPLFSSRVDIPVLFTMWRKTKGMTGLLEKDDTYRANVRQLEQDRKKLESEKASMNNKRTAMESEMQRQKKIGIDEAKQQLFEEATTEINQRKESLKKKQKTMEREKKGLEDSVTAAPRAFASANPRTQRA